ncbi:MAG: nitrilase-related carbon-nitrogen hydrolase [Woeseiaceae bacterium]|nr:nitrilase-related carbon-nitrogen hydrolase [Woeseiaceae bacterium]
MNRPCLLATAAVALAFSVACTQDQSPSPAAGDEAPVLVQPDGTYPTVPLEKEVVVVKVVQNGVRNLQDFESVEEGLEHNLAHMMSFVDRACGEGGKPDFILFNEFPLTGYSDGTREEKLKFTLRIPGPETDALGELARACDTYIIFGSYARDEDWPGHILSINTVIGRDGNVTKKYWKTRNVKRLSADTEIPTTTVEGVRSAFRDRYGIEEEFPILQTEYGNIAVSTVQLDPLVFTAFSMRGVEIMFRTSTLFSRLDVRAAAMYNNFYSAMSNITFPPDSQWAKYGGGSLIVSPRGEVLAEDETNNESIIEAEIPIAEFRANRRIPRYPVAVTRPVFEQFVDESPLDHLDLPPDQLPQTGEAMKELIDSTSRWLNAD